MVSLLANMRQEVVHVYISRIMDPFHHAMNNNVSTTSTHTSTANNNKSTKEYVFRKQFILKNTSTIP